MKTNQILKKLKELKPIYEKEGLIKITWAGSYAKNTQNEYSEIDIAYKLDYNKFSKNTLVVFLKF